jgi:hypothetical protein
MNRGTRRFGREVYGQSHHMATDEAEPGIASESFATRASGRPPEEAESDNPEEQARAILEESEDRKTKGAERSGSGEA